MKTVLKYIKPYMFPFVFCLIIKAVSAFSELAIPRMLAIIIDENVPAQDMHAVFVNGAYMLLFAFLTFLFNVIGNKISAHVTGKISRDLRHDLFEKTVRLDTRATDKIGISSLTSRLTSDTYNIMNFIARIQRLGIKAPLMLLGGVLITLTIDIRLALILIAILPLVCIVVYKITKKSIPIYNEEQKILDGLIRRVDETASGIRVIKALSKTEYEKKRFADTSQALADKEVEAGRVMSLTKPLNDFIFYMGFCIVILVGYFMAEGDGTAAAGKLLAFMTYFTIILNNMIMMSRIFVQTSRAISSASRIEEVLLTDSELAVAETSQSNEGYIVFDNVTFSYNKVVPNLKSISFSLERGETLGIIGATGSGKSTVVNLLLRLYDPDMGNIYIDGRNVKSIPKEELYAMFGVAFQNDFIPAASIKENISFFRNVDESSFQNAIEIAQAEEFISDFEAGAEHLVTTRGTNLSGGQKQRLLIARAVSAKPDILILDDSSSALDYKTDKELRKAIKERINTTTLIVSQRIASVMSSDKILVMNEGEIVATGTHEELLLSCKEYRDIAEVQQC